MMSQCHMSPNQNIIMIYAWIRILRCFRCWCVFGSQVNQPKLTSGGSAALSSWVSWYNYRMVESAVIFRTRLLLHLVRREHRRISQPAGPPRAPVPHPLGLHPAGHLRTVLRPRLHARRSSTASSFTSRWAAQSQTDDRVRRLLWLVVKPGL